MLVIAIIVSFLPFIGVYLWLRNGVSKEEAHRKLCDKTLVRGFLTVLPVSLLLISFAEGGEGPYQQGCFLQGQGGKPDGAALGHDGKDLVLQKGEEVQRIIFDGGQKAAVQLAGADLLFDIPYLFLQGHAKMIRIRQTGSQPESLQRFVCRAALRLFFRIG